MYVPDNYDIWAAQEAEKERQLAELPVCDCCDEPIQDTHYYLINGDNICPACMDMHYRQENQIA